MIQGNIIVMTVLKPKGERGSIMKDLYYSGTELMADLELIEMIKSFREDPRFEILATPAECIIHEMDSSGNREKGNHIGYEYHYVVVKCLTNGNIYHINKAEHYLFEGKWRVTAFLEKHGYEQQARYPFEFAGNADLCKRNTIHYVTVEGAPRRRIIREWLFNINTSAKSGRR